MFGRCRKPLEVREHKGKAPAYKHSITVKLKNGDTHVLTHTDYIKDCKITLNLNPTYQYKHDKEYGSVEKVSKVFMGAQVVIPYSSSNAYSGSHSSSHYMVITEGRELTFNREDMLSIDHVKESIGELDTLSHSTYNA